jgi:hypothetical protein
MMMSDERVYVLEWQINFMMYLFCLDIVWQS